MTTLRNRLNKLLSARRKRLKERAKDLIAQEMTLRD